MISLDPRTKLILMATISFLSIFTEQLWLLGTLFLIGFCLAVLTTGSMVKICRGIIKSLPLLLFFALGLLFFSPLVHVLAVICRFLTIVTIAHIFSNTKGQELMQALLSWKVPYELAFMIMIALHFYPFLLEEAKDIWLAVQLKGIDIKRLKWRERIVIYSSVLLPLIIATMNRAYQLAISMEARGFRVYPQRTFRSSLQMKKLDYCLIVFLAFSGLLTVLLV